jgi:hypothetical protein
MGKLLLPPHLAENLQEELPAPVCWARLAASVKKLEKRK